MTEQEQTYEAVISSDVHSHDINPDYQCLVVDLLNEAWFHWNYELIWQDGKPLPLCLQGLGIRPKLTLANIMPSDVWVKKLIDDMFRISPTFADWLRKFQILRCEGCHKPIFRKDAVVSVLSDKRNLQSERLFFHERCYRGNHKK